MISTFQALYEARLVCSQNTQGQTSSIFSGVSFLKNENTLVLMVRSPDSVEPVARSGRVCTYNISDINAAMDNGLTACINGEIQSTQPVWDTTLPSFSAQAFCASSYNMCSLVDAIFDLEAVSGDDLPFQNSRSSVIIAETGNEFSQFTSSVIV